MKVGEKDKLKRMAAMLKMAGDGTRLRILCAVFQGGRLCVTEIAESLGMSVPTVSHHLRLMANSGLVEPVKEGKTVCYSLVNDGMAADIRTFICKYK